jgi:cation diffusion facilitator CzcD-associated flavoprotein CzcO
MSFTFNTNGTGAYNEYDNGHWDSYNETFTYTYVNNVITIRWDEDNEVETIPVRSLTSTELVMNWDNEGYRTFVKQESTPTATLAPYTWKATFGSNSWMSFTFNANGTGAYNEYDNGHWDSYNETFTYTYANNVITIRWDEENDVETIPVRSLTSTELVMNWDNEGYRTFYKQ